MENKREEMEIIVAVAIKTKEGEVFVSRYSHSELIVMFPDKFRNAKQGFLTSKCRFVDRKEALKIANRYNQIKDNTQNELYSENIFLNEHMQKDKIEKLQKENENFEKLNKDYSYSVDIVRENTRLRRQVFDLELESEKLKKENEELNYKLHSKKIASEIYNRYIPKSKLKDIIDRIDYDIKNRLQELLELSELNSEFNSEGKSEV